MMQNIQHMLADVLNFPRLDLRVKQHDKDRSFFEDLSINHLNNHDTTVVKDLLINYCMTNNSVIVELFEFMIKKYKDELVDAAEYRELCEKLLQIDYTQFTCSQWKSLRLVSIACGLFQAGNICRNKALERALAFNPLNNKLSGLERAELLTALLDTGDVKSAINIFNNTFLLKHLPVKPCRYILRYLYLMDANRERCLQFSKTFYSAEDKLYADYIEGKSVAVVGPAFTDEDLGEEIDKFDVVIRLNYRGSIKQPPKEQVGEKIDVAYYNGGYADYVKEHYVVDFLSGIKCVVLKRKEDSFQKGLARKTDIERTMCYHGSSYFDGTPNMIPLTLVDVLTFNPKRVKLFKTTFYAANSMYYKNYTEKQTLLDQKGYWRVFAYHDLVSQLNLVRNLWKSGLCEVDNTCEKVLAMSNDEYVKTLEEIYAPFQS